MLSRDIYDAYRAQQDIREHDILLVHEGTYLIGRPCLLTRFDTEILIQHHLAHLRVLAPSPIRGELLMAALLAPIVQQQIRARQFTADVIDSIVGRLAEAQLPIPRAEGRRGDLENHAREIFDGRAAARADIAAFVRGLDESLLTGKLRPSGNGSRYSGAVDNALVVWSR